jgi:small subunit ribosomal protein S4e
MTKHQKRLSVPKSWPVERKTETFTVKADAGPHGEDGVPLLVLLRDVLGYVDSRKEARYALERDTVLVNGEPASDERRPIGMFDILSFEERGVHFRVFPDEGGRLALTPIDADSAGSKLSKIEDRTQVPGGDVQLNLHDGTNLRVDSGTPEESRGDGDSAERSSADRSSGQRPREEAVAADDYATGDSVVVDNEDGSVVAHFVYEEGAMVTAVRGQHAGEIGHVESIEVTPGSAKNNVRVERLDGSGEFETVEAYVVVIDENFVDDEADADDVETDEAADEAAADVGGEPQ